MEKALKMISKKTELPILKRYRVKDGLLYATDLDLFLTTKIDLADGIYELVGKEFFLTDDEPAEYPKFPKMDITPTFSIDNLPNIIKKSAKFANNSGNTGRYELEGICFRFKNGILSIISTDSKILYNENIDVYVKDKEFIIRGTKKLPTILKFMGKKLNVTDNDEVVIFSNGDTKLAVRKIDGEYPKNINDILPEFIYKYSVNKKEIKKALKEIRPFAEREIKLYYNGKLVISAEKSKDIKKELEIEAKIENVKIKPAILPTGSIIMPLNKEDKITLNYKYLINVIEVIDEDKIFIYCNNAEDLSPLLFTDKQL